MRIRGALGRHDGSHQPCDACELARQLTEARSFILGDEERRKLTGDALFAEQACVEKDARIAELSRRIDELAASAKEYLMRSVPDPNVGVDAEDSLRCALATYDAAAEDGAYEMNPPDPDPED